MVVIGMGMSVHNATEGKVCGIVSCKWEAMVEFVLCVKDTGYGHLGVLTA
jgi:hypothetical protein